MFKSKTKLFSVEDVKLNVEQKYFASQSQGCQ